MNDDLISRAAAIDALDAVCDRECEYSKQQRSVMCGACRLGSAFDVIDELPSAQPEQRWIPVSERLPNSTEKVLVSAWNPVFDVPIHTEIDRHAIGEEWFLSGKWVTAWMPLPEPYEEEKRNA